jgi:VIT1/CCC1 family predicted Fe2+/Mn2+ transporter
MRTLSRVVSGIAFFISGLLVLCRRDFGRGLNERINLSFEIQELLDVIKIITLLNLQDRKKASKKYLFEWLARIYGRDMSISVTEFDEALAEMIVEGLVMINQDSVVELTSSGLLLSGEWENLFVGEEPVLETVTGLTDGSITGLVVILSSYLTGLDSSHTIFATLLTLASVALTNFSSFFLGGKTEDLSDMISLQRIINFSLHDIPDKEEREKSLRLISRLFKMFRKNLNRSNFKAAIISGVTTFFAGIIPIALYLYLPTPLHIFVSLGFVGIIVGVFLVRYRSRKTRVNWKITLAETVVILIIAVTASLLLGQNI